MERSRKQKNGEELERIPQNYLNTNEEFQERKCYVLGLNLLMVKT